MSPEKCGQIASAFLRLLIAAILICRIHAEAPQAKTGELHFQRAAQWVKEGKLDAGEQEYLAGLKLSPDSPAAYNDLGALYFQQRRFHLAAGAFGKAAHLRPNDSQIAFNLGISLYKEGAPSAAIPALLSGTHSQHARDSHRLLGLCYFSLKEWPQAITELQNFDDPEALFLLARAQHYAGHRQDSLNAEIKLLKSCPDSSFTHEMLGEAHDQEGDSESAIKEFRLAVAAAPGAPQLHFMLGYVLWRWKRYTDAMGPLQEETRINPDFEQSYLYLGDIALRLDDTARARTLFEKALHLNPSDSEARFGLGKVYVKSRQLDQGIATLRAIESQLDTRTELHYWLGKALLDRGRTDEGEKEFSKLKALRLAERQKIQERVNGNPVEEQMSSQ